MTECLHCEINEMVQERIDRDEVSVPDLIEMITESLVDLIQAAPVDDQANLMAHALSVFSQTFLEKGGAFDTSGSASH